MQQVIAYAGMALVIAVLVLLDWRKNQPIRDGCDRFGQDFWAAREHALGGAPPLPAVEESETGVTLLPEQEPSVCAALGAGADGRMGELDRQMEQTLRDMFQAIGKSAHLKRRYYDYCNNLFVLHKVFLQVCADPAAPMTKEDWKDLKLYWQERERMLALAKERMSRTGLAALPVTSGSIPPVKKPDECV